MMIIKTTIQPFMYENELNKNIRIVYCSRDRDAKTLASVS